MFFFSGVSCYRTQALGILNSYSKTLKISLHSILCSRTKQSSTGRSLASGKYIMCSSPKTIFTGCVEFMDCHPYCRPTRCREAIDGISFN